MCFIDLDPCEVWDEKEVKARKEHKCNCCYRVIKAGEAYLRHFNIFEGRITTEKMCLECKADRSEFANDHDGTLCCPHALPNMLRECIGESDEGSPEELRWKSILGRIEART